MPLPNVPNVSQAVRVLLNTDPPNHHVLDRQNAIWCQFDTIMSSRALMRLGAAAAWTVLALVEGTAWWWAGAFATFAAAVSFLHAQRLVLMRVTERLEDRRPVLNAFLLSAFPFPARPHYVDLPSALEVPAALLLGVVTGHWVGAFDDPVIAMAATGFALILGTSFFINIAAHPSYEMDEDPDKFRPLQGLALMAALVIPPVAVWPEDATTSSRVAVLLGCAFLFGSTVRAARHMHRVAHGLSVNVNEVQGRTLHRVGDSLHYMAKGPATGLADCIHRFTDLTDDPTKPAPSPDAVLTSAQQVARSGRYVATRVSHFVESLRSAQPRPTYSATDIVDAILRIGWRDDTRKQHAGSVIEDSVDPAALDEIDQNLLTAVLSELVTNCLCAQAETIEVTFRPVQLSVERSGVEVLVRCVCDSQLNTDVPTSGTLRFLHDSLRNVGGGLSVSEQGAGSDGRYDHTTHAWWPTDSRARR